MLEALRFAQLPARSVSSPHSHLRDERVAVRSAHSWSPSNESVANSELILRSPA
jgi:hypothetical protein